MTNDKIRELVRDAGLDWHKGFNDEDQNRYELLIVAAEAETARKCVEWINAWALDSDRHANMLNSIKQEFPGAWE